MPFTANAEMLCEKVKSKGEGNWPIPEEAFTREKAKEASKDLEELLNRSTSEFLSSKNSGGLDIGCYVLNRTIYIKGYALRSEALESAAIDKEEIAQLIRQDFCNFLKTEAYICH